MQQRVSEVCVCMRPVWSLSSSLANNAGFVVWSGGGLFPASVTTEGGLVHAVGSPASSSITNSWDSSINFSMVSCTSAPGTRVLLAAVVSERWSNLLPSDRDEGRNCRYST